jgi:hypothetical protein
VIREPPAFRALHVEGLGTFVQHQATAGRAPYRSARPQVWELPWTGLTVQIAA